MLWTYVRNGSTSKIYLGSTLVKTTTGLTTAFNPVDVGRFTLGNGNKASQYADMDFYGLLFYNRALTDDEITRMIFYLTIHFML